VATDAPLALRSAAKMVPTSPKPINASRKAEYSFVSLQMTAVCWRPALKRARHGPSPAAALLAEFILPRQAWIGSAGVRDATRNTLALQTEDSLSAQRGDIELKFSGHGKDCRG